MKGARRVREAARDNGTVTTTVTASRADFHRPPTQEVVAFIDAHRDEFGVEPICTVLSSAGLQVAPSTYYAVNGRGPSARACRDAVMGPLLVALWITNYRVYGAHKLWKAARRAGHDIGRDQVARLMRAAGIEGGAAANGSAPLVAPWCAAASGSGQAGLHRRCTQSAVGDRLDIRADLRRSSLRVLHHRRLQPDDRRLAGRVHMRTAMVLDAIEMARWSRGTTLLGCMSLGRRIQFTSIRYGERLAEIGAVPSIGTVGTVSITPSRRP